MSNTDIANEFIDAFYSFNRATLTKVLSNAEESQPNIFFIKNGQNVVIMK